MRKRADHFGLALALGVAACAAPSSALDDRSLALRNGWEKCALFSSANEANTDKPAEEAADAAMALCRDEEARFAKSLQAAPMRLSPADAAALTHQAHEQIRNDKVRWIMGWRAR
ncbi:hypothetical protein [Dongia sedimenti]|uniref:Secreted protein n=1 Tax=Dongia sedimenti TaxID=3064282 RepID=A0ABU0YFS0_9PROT|nr:hypothetical protein [Rhodospirillaceae bacterium R-7]